MSRRKVYAAPLGFYDTVIAAPSKASALAAWGAKYDLFKYGGARIADDPDAVKAALSRPGVVLRRPVGGVGPYSEDPEIPSAAVLTRSAKAKIQVRRLKSGKSPSN